MNTTPFADRIPPGPRREFRAPDRPSDHDLPTRLARARLVFLLARRPRLFDWIALSLAALAATVLLGADLDGREPPGAPVRDVAAVGEAPQGLIRGLQC